MSRAPDRRNHDLIHALRILTALVDFIDEGIDFDSDDGRAILSEAQQAKKIIEAEIENSISRK